MPFYQKISTTFVEIPANAGTAINYALLKKEMDLSTISLSEYRSLLFDSSFRRKEYYKLMPWWMITETYPQSFRAENIFSVVRNPFDRMVTIFFNFTKFKPHYSKYRIFADDKKSQIQEKFEGFIKEYHSWRNISAGAGLNIIEILSRQNPSITKNMYIENSGAIADYYYYDQAYFLNRDFQKNKTVFSKDVHRACEIIKYENIKTIYKKYPKIFTEELVYENFDKMIENGKLEKLSYKEYYNKYTKKFVQEHFEIDFYNFHYPFDFVSD